MTIMFCPQVLPLAIHVSLTLKVVIYSSLCETHLRATECHLPYGITQCNLSPDTGEHALPQPQPNKLVLNLPILEGWKAELT